VNDATMPTADTTKSTAKAWSHYTDAERARVLAVLAEQQNNIAATARLTRVPEQTIRNWARGIAAVPPGDLVDKKKAERAQRWGQIVDAAQDVILQKLPAASARDAALVGGIAQDKQAVLMGDPTAIVQHLEDARVAELREVYAGAAQLARERLGIELPPLPPLPAAPGTARPQLPAKVG
jgi:hypothetical protein